MSPFPSKFLVLPSKKGVPAGLYNGISLCSRHDPLKEAERVISQRDRNAGAALFLGMGMAYQIEAYLEATEDIPLIIVEKEEELFQGVTGVRDLTGLLSSDRVFLLLNQDPEQLTYLLKEHHLDRIDIIPHGTLYGKYREYYDGIIQVVHRWLDRREINLNTLNRFGRLWVRNLAANLPRLAQASALSLLKDQFEGVPALLIAAGPSLEELLPHLKEMAQRTLVIAVDTSYRNLLNHGIKADFLVVTDPQYWNTRHLDFCDLKDSIIISDSSTHPRVLREETGPVYMSRSPFPLAQSLEEGLLDISLKSGGSVATAAWDLAMIMGCSALYCAGLDLGFPGKQTHCRGSFFEERVNFLSSRTAGPEQWSWQALHSAPLHIRKDYQNRNLLSDQRMQVYISWFAEHMEKEPGRTFTLSERGSCIEGLDYRSFQKVLNLPIIRDEIERRKSALPGVSQESRELLIGQRVHELIDSLNQALEPVEEAVKITEELQRAFQGGEALDSYLTSLDQLDRKIASEGAKEIGGFLIQPHLRAIQESTSEGGGAIIENSLKLYSQLAQSLRYHRDIFSAYSLWADKV
jgi:hypothetical protein